jgi:hypothetical protein
MTNTNKFETSLGRAGKRRHDEPDHDEILYDVINTSVQVFENKLYLLPQENPS